MNKFSLHFFHHCNHVQSSISRFKEGFIIVVLEIGSITNPAVYDQAYVEESVRSVMQQVVEDDLIGNIPVDAQNIPIKQVGLGKGNLMEGSDELMEP